jgi:hypothetical protein
VEIEAGPDRPVDQPRVVDIGGDQQLELAFTGLLAGRELPGEGHRGETGGDGGEEFIGTIGWQGGVGGASSGRSPRVGDDENRHTAIMQNPTSFVNNYC